MIVEISLDEFCNMYLDEDTKPGFRIGNFTGPDPADIGPEPTWQVSAGSNKQMEAFRNCFLGIAPTKRVIRQSACTITATKAFALRKIGIAAPVGSVYVNGLVSRLTVDAKPINLETIHTHLRNSLKGPGGEYSRHQLSKTLNEYQLLLSEITDHYRCGSAKNLIALIKERDLLLAMIGSALMPSGFVNTLGDPTSFALETAPLVGEYAVSWLVQSPFEHNLYSSINIG